MLVDNTILVVFHADNRVFGFGGLDGLERTLRDFEWCV